jgi:hypothetical protein
MVLLLSVAVIQPVSVCGEGDICQTGMFSVVEQDIKTSPVSNRVFLTDSRKEDDKKQNRRNVIILIVTSAIIAGMAVALTVKN